MDATDIKDAYKKLKQDIYYENINLFLRAKLAEFETHADMDETFSAIATVLSGKNSKLFDEWLSEIDYRMLPKEIQKPEKHDKSGEHPSVISNNRIYSKYVVSGIRYFIDAPIEILIIDAYWAHKVGRIIDGQLSESCFGARLAESSHVGSFKYYVYQYKTWRDNAIETARTLLCRHHRDVAILSLDIKKFFHCIDIDFNALNKELNNQEHIRLTEFIQQIYSAYSSVVKSSIQQIYPDIQYKDFKHVPGIPIGLASSHILANWYLKSFDAAIVKQVRPAYYGRYVDDVLIVIGSPDSEAMLSVKAFIKAYFKNIFRKTCGGSEYLIIGYPTLRLQTKKLILHDFRKDQSVASLNKFAKELERVSSLFRFLPGDSVECELDDAAYSLLGNGSSNKFRDIVGAKEDALLLSRYLTLQIIAHRLTDDNIGNMDIVPQLLRFFTGQNILDFNRLQEKVFAFLVIKTKHDAIRSFYIAAVGEINKLVCNSSPRNLSAAGIEQKLKCDLVAHLNLSLGISLSLLDKVTVKAILAQVPIKNVDGANTLLHMWNSFRKSNLMRQQYIFYPLLNYIEGYNGSLISQNFDSCQWPIVIDATKREYSPRYIHSNEYELIWFLNSLFTEETLPDDYFRNAARYSNCSDFVSIPPGDFNEKDCCIRIHNNNSLNYPETIKVAIANIKISEDDIYKSCSPYSKPNISFNRQHRLYQLLNMAEREKVELLVLPELAIPHSWLPFMVNHARKHQIALVFGLEHWIINSKVHNLLVSVFPFQQSDKYNSCFFIAREKNYFAPKEKEVIKSFGLISAEPASPVYYYVDWNGLKIASYNCFELTNIKHRGLFREKVDVLTASVYNPDVNYYRHIIEATVRDVHAYTIQSNTSDYGGSCITQPAETELLNIVSVKGGDNWCILTAQLDIKALRKFQVSNGYGSKMFKPLPAGYDIGEARKHRAP